jgi:hypothetical protein
MVWLWEDMKKVNGYSKLTDYFDGVKEDGKSIDWMKFRFLKRTQNIYRVCSFICGPRIAHRIIDKLMKVKKNVSRLTIAIDTSIP